MKLNVWLTFAALLLSAAPTLAAPVTFANTITLDAPSGYSLLSSDEIALKFPNANPPQHVIGNAARNTTVAFNIIPLPPAKPEEYSKIVPLLQAAMQKQQPSAKFLAAEVKTLGPTSWIFYDIETQAMDTGIRNMMLLTYHKNEWVGLNFNSTQAQYPFEKASIDALIASIKLVP